MWCVKLTSVNVGEESKDQRSPMKRQRDLVPVATDPSLRTGDLLRIGSGDYIVQAVHQKKVTVRDFASPFAREFSVSLHYALATRKRAPRRLPHTAALVRALGKGASVAATLIASAAVEGCLDAVDRSGHPALILSARHGLQAETHCLLNHGADVEARGSDAENALFKASARGHVEVVRTLLSVGGAKVNSAYSLGLTALHAAAAAGHRETVRLLLEYGADVELCARTVSQHDAMAMALVAGHIAAAAVLASYFEGGVAHGYSRWTSLLAPRWHKGRPVYRRSGTDKLVPLAESAEQLKGAYEWLAGREHWVSALHCLEWMGASRARELLRGGANLHARRDPSAPSPLEVAAVLIQAGSGCDGTARVSNDSADKDVNHGTNDRTAAAHLVLSAASPWRSSNHFLFPDAARARAKELLRVGYLVGQTFGGQEAHTIVQLWLDIIMPALVTRDSE